MKLKLTIFRTAKEQSFGGRYISMTFVLGNLFQSIVNGMDEFDSDDENSSTSARPSTSTQQMETEALDQTIDYCKYKQELLLDLV